MPSRPFTAMFLYHQCSPRPAKTQTCNGVKNHVFALSALALLSHSWAQTQNAKPAWITGKMLHAETSQPVPGAWLRPLGSGQGFFPDEKGQFSFRLPAPAQGLVLGAPGFYTDTLRISSAITEPLLISLRPLAVLVKELEISAVRASDKMPIAQTTLHREDLAKVNLGKDLPMLLDQTASVVVNSDAGAGVGYTGMRIRGTDPTRTNVTINGIPVNDAESQGVFWVNMPDLASSIATLQIQRGIGTSSHGAGAFGATVNIQTNSLRNQPFASVMSTAGSFRTFRNTIEAGTGLLPGGFTMDVRLSKITSDGFVDRSWSDLKSFFMTGGWYGKKTSVRLNVFSGNESTYQAWNGVPDFLKDSLPRFNSAGTDGGQKAIPYQNETDNYQQDHYQFFVNHEAGKHVFIQGAAYYTRGRGYYEQYKVQADLDRYGLSPLVTASGDSIQQSDLIRQLWLDNHLIGGMVTMEIRKEKWQLITGGALNHYIGDHFGRVIWAEVNPGNDPWRKYYDNRGTKTDGNIYGRLMVGLAKGLTAFLDLQYRHVRYSIHGFRDNPNLSVDETFHFFNPKGGLTYTHPKGHRWYLYYGMASKEPNRVDYETPAAEIPKPETLRDFELGYEVQRPRWRLGVNGYWMDYTNQLILSGKINDVGAYVRTNAPRSFRLGMEMEGAWKPLKWMEVAGNLNVSTNRIIDFTEYVDDYDLGGQQTIFRGNTPIAFSPNYVAGFTLSVLPVQGLELALVQKWVGAQFLDNSGVSGRTLPAFYVPDLRVRYAMAVGKKSTLMLHCTGYNLTNQIYFPNGYSFSYVWNGAMQTENFVYPMAGFHLLGGLQWTFGQP